jgi:hypothetical protein
MKRYKYVQFVESDVEDNLDKKTRTWVCLTLNKNMLGIVKWYSPWRQYCYYPWDNTLYSAGCLRDIADFLDSVKMERK